MRILANICKSKYISILHLHPRGGGQPRLVQLSVDIQHQVKVIQRPTHFGRNFAVPIPRVANPYWRQNGLEHESVHKVERTDQNKLWYIHSHIEFILGATGQEIAIFLVIGIVPVNFLRREGSQSRDGKPVLFVLFGLGGPGFVLGAHVADGHCRKRHPLKGFQRGLAQVRIRVVTLELVHQEPNNGWHRSYQEKQPK